MLSWYTGNFATYDSHMSIIWESYVLFHMRIIKKGIICESYVANHTIHIWYTYVFHMILIWKATHICIICGEIDYVPGSNRTFFLNFAQLLQIIYKNVKKYNVFNNLINICGFEIFVFHYQNNLPMKWLLSSNFTSSHR